MSFSFSFVENDGKKAVTVYLDGKLLVAENNHPNWQKIEEKVLDTLVDGSTDGLVDLFDTQKAINTRFQKVSERVSVRDGLVYFDGEVQHGSLVDHIVRSLDEGSDFEPLVKFMENVKDNPSENSREQLYKWLEASNNSTSSRGFTIDKNGHIRGYKGVAVVDKSKNLFRSITAGEAIVNGEVHKGTIPQTLGDVVEMPRNKVADNPNVACHTGLHVGVWDYAKSFARGAVLEVSFNPRDVVSVPNDHSAQKLRTCRYTVVKEIDAPYTNAVQIDHSDEDTVPEEEVNTETVGEKQISGGAKGWDSSGIVTGPATSVTFNPPASNYTITYNNVGTGRKTDDNYKALKRGPGGRFLPKGS